MLTASSYFPGILQYISIPVNKNAPLLKPHTKDSRWPVMIFSHGLGGSRNTYSHLIGSIASHGVIVIAPEHRDGSTPISYIRDVPSTNSPTEKTSTNKSTRTVDYLRLSHTPSPEVEAGRNAQLRIRLWELGLIHQSLLSVDENVPLTNLNTSSVSLAQFASQMGVHKPGSITFAGHSFGAATVAQFVKSVYCSPKNAEAPKEYTPLFTPSSRSLITTQITPNTPVILLDVWCLPLRAQTTRWLWNQPFPCYSENGPGGAALLAVESQAFFKWKVHLKATKRLLSPNPASDEYDYAKEGGGEWTRPNFFYASNSAHLSQSDFGILFRTITKRLFSVEEPERVLRLNVRAALQVMRNQGIEVSKTCEADMELEKGANIETNDDGGILERKGIRSWNWISTDVSEIEGDDEAVALGRGKMEGKTEPSEAVIANEVMKENKGTSERL
jgi:platelet-activating factor acetylhydrolase